MAFHSDDSGSTTSDRWDRITRQLSAAPRRSILVSLSTVSADREIPVEDAVKETEIGVTPEQLEVKLRHQHLPMLEEAGYVRWSEEPFSVGRGPNFEEVEAVLDVLFTGAEGLPERLVRGCTALENDGGAV